MLVELRHAQAQMSLQNLFFLLKERICAIIYIDHR